MSPLDSNYAQRKDVSITGIITIICHIITNILTSHEFSQDMIIMKESLARERLDRKTYYVKKLELLSINEKITHLQLKVNHLEAAKKKNQIKYDS
jgi:hypothetical protein